MDSPLILVIMIFWFNADELILGVEVFGVCPVCPLAEFI